MSTGLFDADVDLSRAAGDIRVRNGDRLVEVRVASGPGLSLLLRLAALETWLPPSVWEDREAKAYIPSSYAVCVGRADSGEALPDPVQAVSLFPAPLPQLSGSPRRANDYPTGPMGNPQPDNSPDCWNVTTEQAREVAAAFDAAGIETEEENRLGLHYRFDVPEPVSTAVDVNVLPVLPEGAPGGDRCLTTNDD